MMVIILPDHGSRYLNKVYSDNWMKDHGFLEEGVFATARDIIRHKNGTEVLHTVLASALVAEAIELLQKNGISQIPVVENDEFVGSIHETELLKRILEEPGIKEKSVREVMEPPLPFVSPDNTLDVLSSLIDHKNQALLVRDDDNKIHIITNQDLLIEMMQ